MGRFMCFRTYRHFWEGKAQRAALSTRTRILFRPCSVNSMSQRCRDPPTEPPDIFAYPSLRPKNKSRKDAAGLRSSVAVFLTSTDKQNGKCVDGLQCRRDIFFGMP